MHTPLTALKTLVHSQHRAVVLAAVLTLAYLISLPLPESLGFKSLQQYLPWHTAAEFFAISVALTIFALGFSTAQELRNGNFLLIATAFLAAGVLDLFHALSFPGMPAFFTGNTTDKAIYFWLAARATAAVLLLGATWHRFDPQRMTQHRRVLLGLAVAWVAGVTFLILAFPEALPAMYIEGRGLTATKNGAEIVIAALYGFTAWRLWRQDTPLAAFNVHWLAAAIWIMALSELYFTRYTAVSDFFNLMGHLYKMAAYVLAGYALFVSTVREPHRRLTESQARLRESEARLGAVVDSAMDAVIVTDEAQRVVFYNRVAERIFGWPIGAVLGQPVEKLIPESFRTRHQDWVRQFAETGASLRPMGRHGRITGLRANGQNFPAEAAIARIIANGQYYFCVTLRDITERLDFRTTLAQSETRYQTLVANIPGAVYRRELGEPRRVSFMSDGVLALTGYSAEMFMKQSRNWVDVVEPDDLPGVDAAVQAAVAERRPYEIRYRIRHLVRGARWVQEHGTPMFDADGTPQWLDGVIFDITAQKAAEETLQTVNEQLEQRVRERTAQLHESNQRLNEAQRMAHLGSWELDLVNNHLTWSDEIFHIFEIDPARFNASYEAFLEAIHPDDRETVNRAYTESVTNRTPYELVHRLRMPDGRIKHVRERGETRYADGTALRSAGTVQDITAQMLAEAALRDSHALLDAVFDTTHVMIAVLDADLNFIRVNRAYAAADGKQPGYFTGKNHFALFPSRENETVFRQAVRTGRIVTAQARPFEYTHNPERGVSHWDWTLTPIVDSTGKVTCLVLALLNVSNRIQALEDLGRRETELADLNRSLEERVRLRTGELTKAHEFTEAIIDTVGSLVLVLDRDGRIVRFNEACEQLTGWRAHEALGRCVWDFLLTDDEREPVREVFASLRAGQFPNAHENYWVTRAGEKRLIAWSNTALTSEAGEVTFLIATGIDVTERRRTEEALRQSERNFRQLAENIPEVFWLVSPDRRTMHYISPAVEQLWGRPAQDFYRDPRVFMESMHPEDRARIEQEITNQRDGRDPRAEIVQEYRITHPARGLRWMRSRYFPVLNDQGDIDRVAGVVEDITERRAAEEERLAYARAQRDTLVREVHHRIKNNLQGVVGLLRQHATREPALRAPVEAAVVQVGAMALVHGLQARDLRESVALCELTESIARQVVTLTGTTIVPSVTRQLLRPVPLATAEAVPVALIINELLFNAVKHGQPGEPVNVIIDCDRGWVLIRIHNRAAALPEGLDIEEGRQLGTGLSLVRALLPTQGASVALRWRDGLAVAELRLAPPWVELPEDCREQGR